MTEDDEALRIEAALHGEGWAEHTSLERALRAWTRLAEEVNASSSTRLRNSIVSGARAD